MKVLFVRTDKIGDVLLTTPCLNLLKAGHPDIQIDFLASKYAAPILENNPHINEIIIFDRDRTVSGFLKLVKVLRQKKYDAAFLFFVDFLPALALYLARIKIRVGPFSKIYSFFLNRRIKQKRSEATKHEAGYNADLLKALFSIEDDKLFPEIRLSEEEKQAGLGRLNTLGYKKDDFLIGINPSGRGSNLLLPQQRFFEIIDHILEKAFLSFQNIHEDIGISMGNGTSAFTPSPSGGEASGEGGGKIYILITGQPGDLKAYKTRYEHNQSVLIPEEYNLRMLASMISFCRLYISNSTGPLHIAAALSVPTISFYSPIRVTKPVRWGPLYKDDTWHKVLLPPRQDCEICRHDKCPYFNCLSLIPSEEILTAVDSALR